MSETSEFGGRALVSAVFIQMSSTYSHQPGALKKAKKPFKSKHATKGSLKRANKGKVEREHVKSSTAAAYSKQERKNHSIQHQNNKREELMVQKRLGNTNQGPPKLVVRDCIDNSPPSPFFTTLCPVLVKNWHQSISVPSIFCVLLCRTCIHSRKTLPMVVQLFCFTFVNDALV